MWEVGAVLNEVEVGLAIGGGRGGEATDRGEVRTGNLPVGGRFRTGILTNCAIRPPQLYNTFGGFISVNFEPPVMALSSRAQATLLQKG